MRKRFSVLVTVVIAMMLVGPALVAAATLPATVWSQGFEVNSDGWDDSNGTWSGLVTRSSSGTGGITSSSGGFHAVMEGGASSAPFSRFDGYRSEWLGGFTAEVDIYLDPNWASGTGFDYSVAASRQTGLHLRDFIFHVTSDTSTGQLIVGGSNNSNFIPKEDLEARNHLVIQESGWYTFQHAAYDDGGSLSVDLNVIDNNGTILFTETRSNAADTIADIVGGNRYGWFTFINVDGGIAVDNHRLVVNEVEVSKDSCKDGGWNSFGFKNQGQCIKFMNTGKDSR